MVKQNDSSNRKNQPPQSSDDPLRQLNQFQTNHPKQPGNHNQGKQPQAQNNFNENPFQQQLKVWLNQLRDLWAKWIQSPIFERLKENPRLVWIAGGGLVICLLVIVGIAFASGNDESEDVVEEFHQAVLDGDKEKLKDLLESDEPNLEIDDAFLTKFIDSLDENDKYLSFTTDFMRAQKSLYEGKELEAVVYLQEYMREEPKIHDIRKIAKESRIYLKENDGLFSFFGPDYVIGLRPTYIKLSLTSGPTQITLDQKPIQLKKGAKEHVIGPLLPRKYELMATKKYPFAVVEDQQEFDGFKDKPYRTITFDLKGTMVTFKSEIEGTELFINNQSTKKKVTEDGTDFGPVSLEAKLKAYGQFTFPFGTLKSDPVSITSDSVDITPNPFSNEKVKQEVIKRINDYAKEVVEVQKKKDGTLFTALDDNLKNKWINDMADKREYNADNVYKGEAIKTVIAVKNVTITKSTEADTYKIKVPVQYHWREREYRKYDTGNEPLEENIDENYTWLTYNHKSKKWEISELNPIFFGDDLFKDSSVVTTNFK